MIVDDDVAVRAALKDVVDWNRFDMKIVAEARNGKQALELFSSQDIHLVITDMKMPIMDGLEFVREINHKNAVILALSSFDEYELVREAFKLGVDDYILKTNLEEAYITELLQRMRKKLDALCEDTEQVNTRSVLSDFLDGITPMKEDGQEYALISIDLSEEQKRRGVFKDVQNDLVDPMKEIILQIPSMYEHCEYSEKTDSLLLLRYHKVGLEERNVTRVGKQVASVLNDYMNLKVTMSLSSVYANVEDMQLALSECTRLLDQRFVYGEGKIFAKTDNDVLDFQELEREQERYAQLLDAFRLRDNEKLLKEEEILFASMAEYSKEKLHKYCLYMIYLEGIMLKHSGDSFANVFGESVSYSEKLERLINENDYVIWMYNFNRFLFEYVSQKTDNKVEATMELVRRYITDNYADEGICLAEVASVAGLNESYFSTKFKKEFGTSFSEYLKNVRINHAKRLMETTNLKVYEVSQAVGYRNVEHFTRIFKSCVGSTPKQYLK